MYKYYVKGKNTMDNQNMNNNDRGQYSRPFPGNDKVPKQPNIGQSQQTGPLPEQSNFYQRYQNYNPNQPSDMKPYKPFNTWGLIGMISGILSMVACCCYLWVALGLSIFAIICFILSRKVGTSGMAIAGLVCGIITLILCAGVLVLSWIGNSLLTEMGINPNDVSHWTTQDWQNFMNQLQKR